jgi:hypothetical protein
VRLGQQLGLRQAVDGAGAGEHEGFDLVPQRCADQHAALAGIVGEITLGVGNRFADFDVAREMDDDLRFVAQEHVFDESAIADVTTLQ